jgi:hypothetical protein
MVNLGGKIEHVVVLMRIYIQRPLIHNILKRTHIPCGRQTSDPALPD